MSGIHILPTSDHCIYRPIWVGFQAGEAYSKSGRTYILKARTTFWVFFDKNDLWISAARWFARLTISKIWLLNFNWGSMIIPRSLTTRGEVKNELPIENGWCCDIPRSRMTLFELDIPIRHRMDHAYRESRLDWKFVAELVSKFQYIILGHPQKVQCYITRGQTGRLNRW